MVRKLRSENSGDFQALPSNVQARTLLYNQLLDSLGHETSLPGELREDDFKPLVMKIESVIRTQHEEQLDCLNKWTMTMETKLNDWQSMLSGASCPQVNLPRDQVPLRFPANIEPAANGLAVARQVGDYPLQLGEKQVGAETEVDRSRLSFYGQNDGNWTDPPPREATPRQLFKDERQVAPTHNRWSEADDSYKSRAGLNGVSENQRTSTSDEPVESNPFVMKAKAWVGKMYFEAFFCSVIAVNAILMGVQVNLDSFEGGQLDYGSLFDVLQLVFAITFILELSMRVVAAGGIVGFLWPPSDIVWNWLDLFTVLFSVADACLAVVMLVRQFQGEGPPAAAGSMRLFRIVRITRVVRAIRIVRLVRFVRALNTLLVSIISTLNSLVWAMVLLFLIIFLYAILFTELVCGYLIETGYPDSAEAVSEQEQFDVLRARFGGLFLSMNTLFMSISGGIDWKEVADPLFEMDVFMGLLFQMLIAFICFAVLNVMTGVFCEAAMQNAKRDKEAIVQDVVVQKSEDRQSFLQLFQVICPNGSAINLVDVQEALQAEEVIAAFFALSLDPDDAWRLFKLLDVDGDATLSCDEFIEGCMRLKGTAKSIDVAALLQESQSMKSNIKRLSTDMAELAAVCRGVSHVSRQDVPQPVLLQ